MSSLARILLAEDDAATSEAVVGYLSRDGFLVDAYSDGVAARDAISARAGEYSLFIVDLNLPGVSGERLCLAIRRLSSAPIVVVTGKTGPSVAAAILTLGADDFLAKPFSPRELVARVHAKLRPGRAGGDDRRLAVADVALDTVARVASVAGREVPLDRAECAVLGTLIRARGAFVARPELAAETRVAPHSLSAVAKALRIKLTGSSVTVSVSRDMGLRLLVASDS